LKLSLFQKGLFVIAFVLTTQIGFLVFYGWLLKQAEFLAEQEFHNKSVVGRSNWVSTLLFVNNLAGIVNLLSDDPKALQIFNTSKQSMPAELEGLHEVVRADRRQSERVERSSSLINKLYSILEKAKLEEGKYSSAEALRHLTNDSLMPLWSELYNLRHEILSADFAQYKINIESIPKARLQRDNAVFILVLIDIFAAAGLLYVYTHGLTSRLAILVDNANRFRSKQKLNPFVKGNDEITELDRAFHNMSESLELAQQRKQEFLSMISHDMRTPLANVQASLEFVLDGRQEKLSDSTQEWLSRAYENVDTVLSLINELLEIERIEGGGLELVYSDVRLSDLIRKAVNSVRAVAERQSITIVEPKLSVYLKCDEDRLIRVLVNLLGNALKFSPPGSTITVDCKKTQTWLEISVQDQGRGIPSKLLQEIFERYRQVNADDARKLGGSGLGLAITKAIIEAHDGKIEVSSEEGKGSRFVISLPVSLVEE